MAVFYTRLGRKRASVPYEAERNTARFSPPFSRAARQLRSALLLAHIRGKILGLSAPKAVFGLGNDSRFWSRINRGGNTVFIEDNKEWFEKAIRLDRKTRAYLVNYLTQRTQWQELLEHTDRLEMVLANEVEREKWDVILVDGPNGWNDMNPGRMKSIYLSSRLAANSGDVFVHDCHREVEQIYSDRFLRPENLKAEVGLLRHHHLTNRATERNGWHSAQEM